MRKLRCPNCGSTKIRVLKSAPIFGFYQKSYFCTSCHLVWTYQDSLWCSIKRWVTIVGLAIAIPILLPFSLLAFVFAWIIFWILLASYGIDKIFSKIKDRISSRQYKAPKHFVSNIAGISEMKEGQKDEKQK